MNQAHFHKYHPKTLDHVTWVKAFIQKNGVEAAHRVCNEHQIGLSTQGFYKSALAWLFKNAPATKQSERSVDSRAVESQGVL